MQDSFLQIQQLLKTWIKKQYKKTALIEDLLITGIRSLEETIGFGCCR